MPEDDVQPGMDQGLGSRFLEDALNGTQDQDEPRGAPEPASQPQRSGGLRPLIRQKLKNIEELEAKLIDPQGSGSYTRTNEHGQEIFDYVSMQVDQAKLNKLNRELSDLKERDREYATTTEQRNQRAYTMAKEFLGRELSKIPEATRKRTGEIFGQVFSSMVNNGAFAKSDMADRNAVQAVLNQILDTAYGSALRNAQGGQEGAQPASGYDEGDEDQRRPPKEDEMDPFTRDLMGAYHRRKQGTMTVAEAKRRQAEAQRKSREASQ